MKKEEKILLKTQCLKEHLEPFKQDTVTPIEVHLTPTNMNLTEEELIKNFKETNTYPASIHLPLYGHIWDMQGILLVPNLYEKTLAIIFTYGRVCSKLNEEYEPTYKPRFVIHSRSGSDQIFKLEIKEHLEKRYKNLLQNIKKVNGLLAIENTTIVKNNKVDLPDLGFVHTFDSYLKDLTDWKDKAIELGYGETVTYCIDLAHLISTFEILNNLMNIVKPELIREEILNIYETLVETGDISLIHTAISDGYGLTKKEHGLSPIYKDRNGNLCHKEYKHKLEILDFLNKIIEEDTYIVIEVQEEKYPSNKNQQLVKDYLLENL